jgi:hypothetical protein
MVKRLVELLKFAPRALGNIPLFLLPPLQILYISSRLLSYPCHILLKANPHSAIQVLLSSQCSIRNCSTYIPPAFLQAPSQDSDVCICSVQERIPLSLHTMICISLKDMLSLVAPINDVI